MWFRSWNVTLGTRRPRLKSPLSNKAELWTHGQVQLLPLIPGYGMGQDTPSSPVRDISHFHTYRCMGGNIEGNFGHRKYSWLEAGPSQTVTRELPSVALREGSPKSWKALHIHGGRSCSSVKLGPAPHSFLYLLCLHSKWNQTLLFRKKVWGILRKI